MQKVVVFLLLILNGLPMVAQIKNSIQLKIVAPSGESLPGSIVELLHTKDSSLYKVQIADSAGVVTFYSIQPDRYLLRATSAGFRVGYAPPLEIGSMARIQVAEMVLVPSGKRLDGITVQARKPFIELKPDKTIVNLESGISHTGATVLETLEKLPGITVDKDGVVSLRGRAGVLILIDGRQTYLDASQLTTMLSGMTAAEISQIEIIHQPGARYDASGNAGIINIKTKKNTGKGFNAGMTVAYGQGRYPKNNNSVQLNYRNGKWNFFFNYGLHINRAFTRIEALRTYYDTGGRVLSYLDQPSFLTSKGYTHTMRAGTDFSFNSRTSAGINLTGLLLSRQGAGNNTARWMSPAQETDSLIETNSTNETHWKNIGANLNFRHAMTVSRELRADLDLVGYEINGRQLFQNHLVSPSRYSEASRADIPSEIRIFSAKADYAQQAGTITWEAGGKASHIITDNLAAYEYYGPTGWLPDLGKTNHFRYVEDIQALFVAAGTKWSGWTIQSGLRFERTDYDASQLGNGASKDSSFSRSYSSLFPSFQISFAADSNNHLSLSTARRIDRPPFQKLNPFLFIINKYTYQQGNPYYRPQYTWNMELGYNYKGILQTGIGYHVITDYFSQVFPIDSNGIVLYTEGNLGKLENLSLTVESQLAPMDFWSFNLEAAVQYKKMRGFVEKEYTGSIVQVHFNCNNNFRFRRGWAAEVSGFFNSRNQNDIQEVVDPAGQLSAGISKTFLTNKATLKLAARDIFYTQWMKGLTYFHNATEYFKLTRDTKVLTISFTYRFGQAFKQANRSEGAAKEEIQRVGSG